MRTIKDVALFLAALMVATTLSFSALADGHEAGESAGDTEVSGSADAPPADAAPPEPEEGEGDTNEEATD
jgi:hypothetical protein